MTDADEVWAAMRAVYAGFLAADPGAVDALLADDVTIWDSGEFAMVRGLTALRELRARRPDAGAASTASVVALEPSEPVIDVWDDTALVRHVLRVQLSDGTHEVVRNTSVWRRVDGRWLAVHNHEDVAGGGARP